MWEAESSQVLCRNTAHTDTPWRCYLITVLDELLPADVGHDPSSQRVSQDIDHCSKPVSGKWNSNGKWLALWVHAYAFITAVITSEGQFRRFCELTSLEMVVRSLAWGNN